MKLTVATKIKRLEDRVGKIGASGCGHCDFGMGTRGMDRCAKCDGTGSVFRVGLSAFPNTEIGYLKALQARSRA